MKVIRGLHNMQSAYKGACVTIGNFDGLHLGHRAIVDTLKQQAAALHAPTMLINFHPSPDSYFQPSQAKAKLTSLREKLQLLREWGIDYVLLLPFNAAFASLSATQFIDDVLIAQLNIKGIVVGDDFRFGYQRQGTVQLLQDNATSGSYQCITLTEQQDDFVDLDTTDLSVGATGGSHAPSSHRISSTRTRQALSHSDFALAETLLGRPFSMEGRVRPGQMRGRLLGFPTANIPLGRRVSPLLGVFAGWVSIIASKSIPLPRAGEDGAKHQERVDGIRLPAVANIGWRPTVGGTKEPLLEIHLLNYQGDLYGKRLQFIPVSKIRDEQKFSGLDALQAQLHADVALAKQLLTEALVTLV